MDKKEIIKYYSEDMGGRESIIIYDDEIIYTKNNLKISNSSNAIPEKERTIRIKDKNFVDSMIFESVYMPIKQQMIDTYDKVRNMDIREIHRPKNTAQKRIVINDKEFVANVDMYIEEMGNIFEQFIITIKKMINIEINK